LPCAQGTLCRLHATATATTVPAAVLVHIRIDPRQIGRVWGLTVRGHSSGATYESQDNTGHEEPARPHDFLFRLADGACLLRRIDHRFDQARVIVLYASDPPGERDPNRRPRSKSRRDRWSPTWRS